MATFILRLLWKTNLEIKDNYLLTFDDGPSEISIDLIKNLKKHNKEAIFFLLGEKLASYNVNIYEDFEIGCHGYRHVNFALLDPYRTYKEFKKAIKSFEESAIKPRYFRAPYGLYNLTLLYLIKKANMEVFQWDYLLGDWILEEEGVLYNKIKNKAKNKNILVLHDGTEGSGQKGAKERMLKEICKFLDE